MFISPSDIAFDIDIKDGRICMDTLDFKSVCIFAGEDFKRKYTAELIF